MSRKEAPEPDLASLEKRMDGAVEALRKELSGLRAGRASASMLEPVVVEAYGTEMPLNQLATVSVPEPRLLTVQVWDRANTKAVEKAIRSAQLGLNPMAEGSLIRVPLPELTQERRNDLVKVAHKYAEQARIAIRNVRRDGMDMLKKMERDGELSQDDHALYADEVQAMTDRHIEIVAQILAAKEKDITTV